MYNYKMTAVDGALCAGRKKSPAVQYSTILDTVGVVLRIVHFIARAWRMVNGGNPSF